MGEKNTTERERIERIVRKFAMKTMQGVEESDFSSCFQQGVIRLSKQNASTETNHT